MHPCCTHSRDAAEGWRIDRSDDRAGRQDARVHRFLRSAPETLADPDGRQRPPAVPTHRRHLGVRACAEFRTRRSDRRLLRRRLQRPCPLRGDLVPPKRAVHRGGGRHGGEERRANRGQEHHLVARRHPDRLRGRRQAPDPDRGRRQRPVAHAIRISARRHSLGEGPLVTGMRTRAANPIDRAVLRPGASDARAQSRAHSSPMRTRFARGMVIALGVGVLSLAGYARFGPLDAPETKGAAPGTVVLDVNGNVLERDGRSGLRIPVSLASVAPKMLQATISAEDRRFQQHFGVDPIALARAVLSVGSQPSGASTITQQLARRLYLADDPSPLAARKAHEALIALQLEANRSKSEILELYLNDVYYGRGAYGVEAAARVYFGIGAGNLDLAHAAYLAGLPQRPSDQDSANDSTVARGRQAYVLGRMVQDGWISAREAEAAASERIDVLPALSPPIAHEFVAYAR